VDGVDKSDDLTPPPTGEQKQKKRTFDELPKPDILIRYQQLLFPRCGERRQVFAIVNFKRGLRRTPRALHNLRAPKRQKVYTRRRQVKERSSQRRRQDIAV
jgi:hypothetical protein